MDKYITKTLSNHGIDLYNAEYQDASDITPRDPRWSTGGILTVLLRDPGNEENQYYICGDIINLNLIHTCLMENMLQNIVRNGLLIMLLKLDL